MPTLSIEPYQGTHVTIQRMQELSSGDRGERSYRLRRTIEDLVRHVQSHDVLSQAAAVYHWFFDRYTFVSDPVEVELVRDPLSVLDDIETYGRFAGDCDDASTFLRAALRVLGIKAEFLRVGFAGGKLPGGLGRFSHVLVAFKLRGGPWIVLDPVAGTATQTMLSKVKQSAIGGQMFGADIFGRRVGLGDAPGTGIVPMEMSYEIVPTEAGNTVVQMTTTLRNRLGGLNNAMTTGSAGAANLRFVANTLAQAQRMLRAGRGSATPAQWTAFQTALRNLQNAYNRALAAEPRQTKPPELQPTTPTPSQIRPAGKPPEEPAAAQPPPAAAAAPEQPAGGQPPRTAAQGYETWQIAAGIVGLGVLGFVAAGGLDKSKSKSKGKGKKAGKRKAKKASR